MKHSIRVTLLLLLMFFSTQLIGLFVISQYAPITTQVLDDEGNLIDVKNYNLPYGVEPPKDTTPQSTLISIVIAIAIAVLIMLLLMKYNAAIFFKIWFFLVVTIALAITFNALIQNIQYASSIALIVALPLAYFKIFKRNIYLHNITELAVYPGIAIIFVPLLNIWTTVILLILISLYDMYAVWHAGFMQKMARYQIEKLQLFTGFFIPYMSSKEKQSLIKAQKSKTTKSKRKVKVSLAILGGGDVVFPIILAGVVFNQLGLIPALIVSLGATVALAGLFYLSEKGKFYPAMPFISAGCFIALGLAYLI